MDPLIYGAERVLENLQKRLKRPLKRRIESYDPDEARDDKGRWAPGGGSGNIGSDKIEQSPFKLTPEQRAAEDRFRDYIGNHTTEAADEYRNGKDGRKGFGNVLNADDAKSLSADFRKEPGKFAMAAHEPASTLINKVLYPMMLKEPVPRGKDNNVLFTAGGGGAGKSSGLAASPALQKLADKAHIVYDGTFANANKAASKIDDALKAGKHVDIVFVHRDPVDAMLHGVVHRAEPKVPGGPVQRVVPLQEFASQHSSVQDAIGALYKKYQDNPKVTLYVVDNSFGLGQAKESALHKLSPPKSRDELIKVVGAALKKHHENGGMSRGVYDAITQNS